LVEAGGQSWRIEKAERFMLAAQRAFEAGDWERAVSRAYYAAYHAVVAALEAKGDAVRLPRSHRELHGLMASTQGASLRILDPGQTRDLRRLYNTRFAADYLDDFLSRERASEALEMAHGLLARTAGAR
jgi:uncharacterized protein (UPF0332 family)